MKKSGWGFGPLLFLLCSASWAQNQPAVLGALQRELTSKNVEILSAKAKVNSATSLSRSTVGLFLPEISLQGGYGKEDTLADHYEGYLGSLNGTWNLFRGGQDRMSYQIASQESDIAKFELDSLQRRLRRELGEAYYEALANQYYIDLDTEKLSLLKNQRTMSQRKIDAGLTSQVDAIELDLEESTLSSEIETHKADLKISLNKIGTLLSDPNLAVLLEKDSFPNLREADFAAPENIHHPDIERQIKLEEVARLERRANQSSYLPSVDLNAQYGQLIPQFENPTKGAESKVTILFTWNLFSGLKTFNKDSALKFNQESKKQDTMQTQLRIKSDLHNTRTKAAELIRLRDLLEKREVLAQKYYDLTLSEYRRGVKNSADLASATTSLFENKTKLIQVKKDLALLKLKLDEIIL